MLQESENEGNLSCYVCHQTESSDGRGQLKEISESLLATVKHAAALRKNLKSDKYREVTQAILVSSDCETVDLSYHPSCHKCYTAVKRLKDSTTPDEGHPPKIPCTERRSTSAIPKSNEQGMLKGTCIFCGKSRKKKNGKDEVRLKVAKVAGCQSLRPRVEFSKNERIKGLVRSGVDLIAKEAEYHKSCRQAFLKETDKQDETAEKSSSKSCHKTAFASLLSFVEDEVLKKQRSILVSDLLGMYKEEFSSIGETGTESDVPVYTAQNLTRKLKDYLKDKITITLLNQRKGNFIHSADIPKEEANNRLHKDAKRCEENSKLIWAALHLRSQIMQLSKTRTPNPATVQNLKECASELPEQVDLFFRNLLGGIAHISSGIQKDALDRKVIAMGSDAVYNVTRGTVKPWKHTAMGLGLASLTGSKLVTQILNRSGHCISYSEVKCLETEFAYSVAGEERDTPDGIHLDPCLATACVWDNNRT